MNREKFEEMLASLGRGSLSFLPPEPAVRAADAREGARLLYEPHSHRTVECIYLAGGAAEVFVSGRWRRFPGGETWVFLPGTLHCERRADRRSPYRIMWLVFHSQSLNVHATCHDPSRGYYIDSRRLSARTPFTGQMWETCCGLGPEPPPLMKSRFQILLMEIIFYIINNFQEICSQGPDKSAGLAEQVRSYIERNYSTEDLSLKKLSSIFHYSPGHLNSVFRRHAGMPVHRYILRKKLEQAKLMLESERPFIKDVCERLGFKDQLYFSRLFKKHFGTSPSSVSPNKYVEIKREAF